jgi:hypothetical protein
VNTSDWLTRPPLTPFPRMSVRFYTRLTLAGQIPRPVSWVIRRSRSTDLFSSCITSRRVGVGTHVMSPSAAHKPFQL